MHRYGPFCCCFSSETALQNRIGVQYNREDPEENTPADLIKLPLIRKCGDSESRQATTPAEQVSRSSRTQPRFEPARLQGKLETRDPKIDPSCPFLNF